MTRPRGKIERTTSTQQVGTSLLGGLANNTHTPFRTHKRMFKPGEGAEPRDGDQQLDLVFGRQNSLEVRSVGSLLARACLPGIGKIRAANSGDIDLTQSPQLDEGDNLPSVRGGGRLMQ
jgi:hypothetical protein